MIRLAWHWLERWHEPLSVGASVALFGLVYLMPIGGGAAFAPLSGQPQQASSAAYTTPQRSPADAQYYRDQWSREAAQFYALHPPRREERSAASSVAPAVTTAKASFAPSQPTGNAVAQATHVTATTLPRPQAVAITALPSAPQPAAAGPPEWIKRWRIAAALAAGLLAGFAFVSVWPASPIALAPAPSQRQGEPSEHHRPTITDTANGAAPLAAETAAGELIAIRLPAAWVGVRPTSGETLRRAILAASYLIASLCGWSLLG